MVTLLLVFIMSSCSTTNKSAGQEMGTLWYQSSAENKALIYQAFNLAKLRLDQALRKRTKKKKAVVVDVDETIVDNSPYQVWAFKNKKAYESKTWANWIELASAKALPGAVDFLNYAHKKGVKVFFITNRKQPGYEATLKNLKELGFPVTRENLILRQGSSHSKEVRRELVRKNYEIVLLMGDSLGDFGEFFEKKSFEMRAELVKKYQKEFGNRFIVLPNPMYGEWLGSVYDYNYELSDNEKSLKRYRTLKGPSSLK